MSAWTAQAELPIIAGSHGQSMASLWSLLTAGLPEI
jgi:hypothetical protein